MVKKISYEFLAYSKNINPFKFLICDKKKKRFRNLLEMKEGKYQETIKFN